MIRKAYGKKQKRHSSSISLPHGWTPYPWQKDVLAALQGGCKRFCLAVHRRAGKDQVALNMAAIASQFRVGQYWHILPYASQSKTNIWNGVDKSTGVKFIDQSFPNILRKAKRENLMELDLINGSQFKILGSDNYNAFRSGNPLFVAFSEAAYIDPDAWLAMSPILRENDGIAVFISTPDGQNWFHKMFESVKDNPDWYTRHLGVDQTCKWDGSPIITPEQIELERAEGKSEDYIRREFYCDFETGVIGAYYINELHRMRNENRITPIEYDDKHPVTCVFDLGFSDELVALFFQKKGNAHYMIASRSWQYTEMNDALDEIEVVYPWRVSKYVLPHDAGSRVNRQLILNEFEKRASCSILERGSNHAGIQTTRKLLSTLWIDNAQRDWGNNDKIIEAIGAYRSKQSSHGVASSAPLHNWASHWADALRYYAVGHAQGLTSRETEWGPPPNYSEMDRIARTLT